MTEVASERMLQRMQTLITQAEQYRRTGSDAEADAALGLASRLALKYSLDLAGFTPEGTTEVRAEIGRFEIGFSGIYNQAHMRVAFWFVKAFGGATAFVTSKQRNTCVLTVLTTEATWFTLQPLLHSLDLQCQSAVERYWRGVAWVHESATAMQKFKVRRDFIVGFGQGVEHRVKRARADLVAEFPGTDVALRTIDDQLAEILAGMTMSKGRALTLGSSDGLERGFEAGVNANTGERPVATAGRRQLGR